MIHLILDIDWGLRAAHSMLCARALTKSRMSTMSSRRTSRWGKPGIVSQQYAIDLMTFVYILLMSSHPWLGRPTATRVWQWPGPRMVESSKRWKLNTGFIKDKRLPWWKVLWSHCWFLNGKSLPHARLRWHLSRCLAGWLLPSQFGPYEPGTCPGNNVLINHFS